MPYYYGFDWTYVVLVLPCIILSLWASANVNGTFKRYSQQFSRRGLTGAEAASRVLSANGVTGVRIERISGSLHDYGIKLLQKQFDLDDECIYELEGYMDFARYGQESAKRAGFVQTEFGQVRRIGQSLEQTYSDEMTL